jgi:hypothetical protein
MDKTSEPELRQKLNQETGRIHWSELERHCARGVLVKVDAKLDLVEVAANMAADDAAQVQDWLERGVVQRVSADDAKRWKELGAELWAVVVAPWVLVQEVADRDRAGLQ